MDAEKERLIRRYAEGGISWHDLQGLGFSNCVQLFGGLGDLGLRPPIATMDCPNVAARQRGRALLRLALLNHP